MILIAPDKFKGTFSAQQICSLVYERLKLAGIKENAICRPLSDGGEGIASVLMPGAKSIDKGIYEKYGRRLVVSSEIVGFDAFVRKNIPLMERSSIELGKAISPHIPTLIAVGGTAVSDGGAGFLQGLGVRFFDSHNNLISEPLTPKTLTKIHKADTSPLDKYKIEGIIDVRASLTKKIGSENLSTIDFARQKALPNEDLSNLNDALWHLKKILGGESQWDGAGGGLGYAIASVCKAKCVGGAENIVSSLDINWDKISLVITGEGKVDTQTVKGGKIVDAVYRKALRHNIPTLILYGCSEACLPYPHLAQIDSLWEPIVSDLLRADKNL